MKGRSEVGVCKEIATGRKEEIQRSKESQKPSGETQEEKNNED